MSQIQKDQIVKAAVAWALQRQRCMYVQSLGIASARAALRRKADKLSTLALQAHVERFFAGKRSSAGIEQAIRDTAKGGRRDTKKR